MRSYLQSRSSLRLFLITIPILVIAYRVLSLLVPEVLRWLLPYPVRMMLGLL